MGPHVDKILVLHEGRIEEGMFMLRRFRSRKTPTNGSLSNDDIERNHSVTKERKERNIEEGIQGRDKTKEV